MNKYILFMPRGGFKNNIRQVELTRYNFETVIILIYT